MSSQVEGGDKQESADKAQPSPRPAFDKPVVREYYVY